MPVGRISSTTINNISPHHLFKIKKDTNFSFLYTQFLPYLLHIHNTIEKTYWAVAIPYRFFSSPVLIHIPFPLILPLFLCLSEVETKDTQCFSYSDIIWSTMAISLYMYILLSLCTQTVPFIILCKRLYFIGMLTLKDPSSFLHSYRIIWAILHAVFVLSYSLRLLIV